MPNGITRKDRTDMAKKSRVVEYEESSGNVFADLGLPNPDQELLKTNLTLQIFRAIKARKLTQAKAAGSAHHSRSRAGRITSMRAECPGAAPNGRSQVTTVASSASASARYTAS